jgi:DNA-binding NtrC family response regulator
MSISTVLTSPSGGVLVASASTSLREQVRHSLHGQRGPVQEACGGADALVKLESGNWQVLFLDRRLPDLDVEELIGIIKRRFPGIEVVMLDSDNVKAPARTERPLTPCCRTAQPAPASPPPRLSSPALAQTWAAAPQPANLGVEPLPGMIGRAESMQRLYRLARLVAPRTTSVLILGPTGTGKELVARALHQLGSRAARPLVTVNCAAIPEALLEAELFGHTRGAFTGAVQAAAGRIPAAHGGTLFLDEVGELPLSLQAKLLRFLDQKEVQRLGSPEVLHLDVRVVAATNADLEERVEQGRFRRDLYYRLSSFPLELPALADRRDDLPALAEHFLRRFAAGSPPPALTTPALRRLEAHPWEGNVRELQQVMERAVILAEGAAAIQPAHLYFLGGERFRPAPCPDLGRPSLEGRNLERSSFEPSSLRGI